MKDWLTKVEVEEWLNCLLLNALCQMHDHSNFLTNVFFEVEEVEMTKK